MMWQNDHLAYDWFQRPLPENVELGANVYIESSYVFAPFFSQRRPGLIMDDGSGAYDVRLRIIQEQPRDSLRRVVQADEGQRGQG